MKRLAHDTPTLILAKAVPSAATTNITLHFCCMVSVSLHNILSDPTPAPEHRARSTYSTSAEPYQARNREDKVHIPRRVPKERALLIASMRGGAVRRYADARWATYMLAIPQDTMTGKRRHCRQQCTANIRYAVVCAGYDLDARNVTVLAWNLIYTQRMINTMYQV